MGLDQYLTKKIYIGNKHRKEEQKVKLTLPESQEGVMFPVESVNEDNIQYIIEEIGYWRKANAIHNWFFENVQGGDDNCAEYEVSQEKLEELAGVCKAILENHKVSDLTHVVSADLLPTQGGFFFGNTEYDDYYYNQVQYTLNLLEELFTHVNEHGYLTDEIYYSSSW